MHKYLLPALALLCIEGVAAGKAPTAIRLSASNVAQLQPQGPDAIAGIGDWLLSNGTLCATVSDIEHETGFNTWGGALIDVYHCALNDDQWPLQHALPNLNKDKPLRPETISASRGDTQASITVTSRGYGLNLTSEYRVDLEHPSQLVIDHELIRTGEGEAVTMFGLLVLHPHLSMTPYSIATEDAQFSQGFEFESLDRTDRLAMVKAMNPADLHVLVGREPVSPISYGIRLEQAELIKEDGQPRPLPRFQLTDPTYSFQGVLSRPPWIGGEGKLGLTEFAQSRLMDLKAGEILKVRQRIYLGKQADVASVTDQIYTGPVIHGELSTDDAVIHIEDTEGNPTTSIRAGKDKQFSARLPADTNGVNLRVNTPWGETKLETSTRGKTRKQLDIDTEQEQSFVVLPKSGPMRLVFKGIGNTADPDFTDDLLDFKIDGAVLRDVHAANYVSLAGIASDEFIVALRPGKYQVYATRGMSYNVTTTEIEVLPGETVILNIDAPMREIAAENWLAADFHVHAAPSFDSALPINDRLRSFVAQGSDVLVATEHNVLVDYKSRVSELGLDASLSVINGLELTGMARTEVTPFTNGHLNVFPTQAKPRAFSGGLPRHEGLRLRDVYQNIRAAFGNALVQLNHPRLSDPLDVDGDNSYFEHLLSGTAYDYTQPLSSPANQSLIERDRASGLRDLDFDLMEIANGSDYQSYEVMKLDWFSLLDQGEKIFGSANSDSHGRSQLVTIPQNFVQASLPFDEGQFIESVRSGALFGTTGPFLEVHASGPNLPRVEPGGTVATREFTLSVHVTAASWVPIENLSIYINGVVHHQQKISRGETVNLPVNMEQDGYILVEVTGAADYLYSVIAPNFTPFAFSNPIFVETEQ
ncbi:MAG: CehA/McbA family metallohydrolase [Halioglobus sp.]